MHAHVRYENVRVPAENLLGGEGKAFEVAQRRLGGGRIHHAMRTVAGCQRYFEMMCERALSRTTKGGLLAEKQMVQEQIAESWIEIQEFRLLVLYTAWLIDNSRTPARCAGTSPACKVRAAQIMSDDRLAHDAPPRRARRVEPHAPRRQRRDDGDGRRPDRGAQGDVAQQVLKQYKPSPDNWPTAFRPRRLLESRRNVRRASSTGGSAAATTWTSTTWSSAAGERRRGEALRGVPRAHRELVTRERVPPIHADSAAQWK